jgi:adenylate cyclase
MTEQVTVLAVDDQPANLRLLDAILSPRDYRVITASSGEQALDLLPSSDLIWYSSTS